MDEKELLEESIIKDTAKLDIISIVGMPVRIENKLYNTAVIVGKGEILGVVPKTYIDKHGEEGRWFSTADTLHTSTVNLLGKEVVVGTDILFSLKNFIASSHDSLIPHKYI